jgi:hypothetical protein
MYIHLNYLRLLSLFAWIVAGSLGSGFLISSSASQAKIKKYVCSGIEGVPTTHAITVDGELIPVIRWTNRLIDISGWSRERRCEEVSRRMDALNRQGRLKYFTHGRINGRSVICTALGDGLGCDALLLTLKPWQDARSFIQRLRLLDRKVGPLEETNARLYVSIDELLSTPYGPPMAEPRNMNRDLW